MNWSMRMGDLWGWHGVGLNTEQCGVAKSGTWLFFGGSNMNSLWSFTRGIRPTLASQFVTRQSAQRGVERTLRGWLSAALLGLVLLTAGSSLAQRDPFVGTWELNVAKSKFGPGAECRSETRIVKSSPTGMKVSVDRTNSDGSNQQYNYTTNFDGKTHPITGMGRSGADSVAVTLGTSNALSFKLTKGGKAVGSGTSVVSADGMTLTLTSRGIDANGKTISSVAVYDQR